MHIYDIFGQRNNVVKMTATTGACCRAVGSNYFEGSETTNTLEKCLKQLFPGQA